MSAYTEKEREQHEIDMMFFMLTNILTESTDLICTGQGAEQLVANAFHVKDEDVEQCWDMLRRKVGDACASLPPGASAPMVKDDFGNVYGMFMSLTGDGLTDRELSDYAELIKREVSDLEGWTG